MAIDWDANVLKPLHDVFGEDEDVIFTHIKTGESYSITGIFDRAYTKEVEFMDVGIEITTTKPLLGVRDIEFKTPPLQGDTVYIESVKTKFVVKAVHPDSHGGSRLELNALK